MGTTTPTPNAIPYADVSGLLDDWVSTASTTTLGKVKISTTPLLVSNPIAVGTNDLLVTKAVTGGTYSDTTKTLTLTRNDGTQDLITGFKDWYTTGFTYSNNTFRILDNSGTTLSATINSVTGLTVNGTLSASTISATTLNVNGTNVNPKQTIALFFGHDTTTMLNSQTFYFGNMVTLAALTSASDGRRVIIPKTGNIVKVTICRTVSGTLGSSESATFTINNVTQATQSTIATTSIGGASSSNNSYVLSSPLAVNEDDKVEIRITTPIFTTAPTGVRHTVNVYLEY